MKIRDVTTSRLRHSVVEAGAGGEPLLLVHGFGGAKEDFTDFVDSFADRGWHVVVPDHRGHGASDKPDDEAAYTLPAMADDMVALADTLGWDRFALLGHSLGGMAAQLIAIAHPERLTSLVLMDTLHGAIEGRDPEVLALAAAIVRDVGIERFAEISAEHDTTPKLPAEVRVRAERPGYDEFMDRKMLACSPVMYAAVLEQMPVVDDRLDVLTGLPVRTLVVVGEQDTPFLGQSRRLAEAIPGAVLEVIADAGHSPQFENPDRWWRVVTRFLEDGRPG